MTNEEILARVARKFPGEEARILDTILTELNDGIANSANDIAALESQAALFWVDVAATAALLDSAGSVLVMAGEAGVQYKVREIILVGGGTNFGAGGNRLLDLTDGTTVWTTVPNANLESAPATSLRWGETAVPFLTGTSNTASAAGADIVFEYSGGTTDHSTGSITFSVCLERV